MRIISQNGFYDFPYDKIGLYISPYNEIMAVPTNLDYTNERSIAKYSTEEHALRAMEMLHSTIERPYLSIGKDGNVDFCEPWLHFKFPNDSEIED